MRTKINLVVAFILGLLFIPFISNASENKSWASFGSTPSDIVTRVTEVANDGAAFSVQDTKLNAINNTPTGGPSDRPSSSKYQISNTFIWLATSNKGVSPYIQWLIYIGMVGAVILLIYNGYRLVRGKKLSETKEDIKYILVGVILMTGFYAIIKVVTIILNYFFA